MNSVKEAAKNRVKPVNQASINGHENLVPLFGKKQSNLILLLIGTIILVLSSYLQFQWAKRPTLNLAPPESLLPPLHEVVTNFKLMLHGYRNGYLKTIIGYLIFLSMASFFIATGRYTLKAVFKNSPLSEQIGGVERLSLSYILGSLLASLLWLCLGVMGFLNGCIAFGLCIAGVFILFNQMRGQNVGSSITKSWSSWKAELTLTEKILTLLLVTILIAWSTTSVQPQTYSDTLISHLVLPNFYINQGSVVQNPFHIQSYFTQNTEMLVMWGLLLNSEIAAALLIWGFLAAFILLALGFVRRYTDNFICLLCVFGILSAPIFSWFSTAIKNDFPVGLFLFAHYLALSEFFKYSEQDQNSSKNWILLSGLLCGGAIGHKLVALPAALISTGFITYHMIKKTPDYKSYMGFWVLGLGIATAPWLIRSVITTGNPIYPYFNVLFMSDLIKPWHATVPQQSSIAVKGWIGLINYLRGIVGVRFDSGTIQTPDWGPLFLLIPILSIFILLRSTIQSHLKMTFFAAILSWMGLVAYSLEIRYHLGFIVFCFAISFIALHKSIVMSKAVKILFLSVIILCSIQTLIFSRMTQILRSSVRMIVSGFPLGSYRSSDADMDSLRWLCHLIETRTLSNEAVLYIGINYAYGLKRKIFFSSDLDRQFIAEIADQSYSADDLVSRLSSLGVKHILMHSNFFDTFRNHPNPNLRISDDCSQKINSMLQKYAHLKFLSPDGKILWFTLTSQSPLMSFNDADAVNFSSIFTDQAQSQLMSGNLPVAQQMLERVVNDPVPGLNKVYAAALLGSVYQAQKQMDIAERTMASAIDYAPDSPQPYLNLAVFYANAGQDQKIGDLVEKAIARGGKEMAKATTVLSKFVNEKGDETSE